MRKRNTWKRAAAWILTAAMMLGDGSFAALAEGLEEAPVLESVEGLEEAAVPEPAAEMPGVMGAEEAAVPELASEMSGALASEEVGALSEQTAEAEQDKTPVAGEDEMLAAEIPEADAAQDPEEMSGADFAQDPGSAAEADAVQELPAGEQSEPEDALILGEDEISIEEVVTLFIGEEGESAEGTQEPQYELELPLTGPKEDEMLPGQEIWLGNCVRWWSAEAEEPIETPITAVEILKEYTWDEDGAEIEAEPGSVVELRGNGDEGWSLRGVSHGIARLKFTFENPSGETETFGCLPEDGAEIYEVYVYGDIYHVEWDYPNGTENLLCGDTMEIPLSMTVEYYGDNGEHRFDPVTDVRFSLETENGTLMYDQELLEAEIVANPDGAEHPYELRVTGKATGSTTLCLNALIPNEEGAYEAVSWAAIGLNVCESYVNLEPVRLAEDKARIGYGETLTLSELNLGAVAYSPDNSRMSAQLDRVRFRIPEEGYDADAWEPIVDSETGNITALKRKGLWDTEVCVVAEQNQPEEDGSECWVQVAERTYWFEENYYEMFLEGRHEDGWSWVYTDEESYPLPLNTDGLAALAGKNENVVIDWVVGLFDEEGTLVKPAGAGTYTIEEETNQMILNGTELIKQFPRADESEDPCIGVRAIAQIDQNTVAWTESDIRIREPYYDYYGLPALAPGDRDLIPGQDLWIDATIDCYAEDGNHPYGDQLSLPVTNVEIAAQGDWDEAGNEIPFDFDADPDRQPVLTCEQSEDGSWCLHAQAMGWARVHVTYTDVDGQEKVYGEDAEDPFLIGVGGEVYRAGWSYPDGTEKMLYPGELLVTCGLRREYLNEWNDFCCEEVTDFRLDDLQYDDTALDAAVTEDGRGILLTSLEPDREEMIYADILVPDDEAEDGWRCVCGTQLHVEITGGYYVIRFETPPESGEALNPEVGDVLDLNTLSPAIYACSTDNPDGVRIDEENENLRISLIRLENEEKGWDPNAWEVVEGTEGDRIPQLRRTESWETGVTLFIEERCLDADGNPELDESGSEIWQEAGRLDYVVPEQDYSISFANLRGENGETWVYRNENYGLELNTDALAGKNCEIRWSVGYYDDTTGEFIGSGKLEEFCTVDGNVITVNGDKVPDACLKPDTDGFHLRATVVINGIEVNEEAAWVRIVDPCYDYDYPLDGAGENILLPGWEAGIETEMNCYVENGDHPYGENLAVPISEVEILGQGTDWNWEEQADQNYDLNNEDEILALESSEADGWTLRATGNGFGFAHVQITYTDVYTAEHATYDFPVFVSGERYSFWWDYSDHTDFMLPNSELTVTTGLSRWYLDENNEQQEETLTDYQLSVTMQDEQGQDTATYDTELLTVTPSEEDPTVLTICSNENQWSTDIYARVLRPVGENGAYEEVFGDSIHINVSESYFKLEPDALVAGDEAVNPLLDESLTFADYHPALYYYQMGEERSEIPGEEIRYRLEFDENAWEIQGAVSEEAVTLQELPTLARRTTWGTSVWLLACVNSAGEGEAEDWQEAARTEYFFEDISDRYQADLFYSYGSRMDEVPDGAEVITSRVLTDIPLVLTLDTAGLHGAQELEGFSVEWKLWQDDEQGNQAEPTCATWEIAGDGRSVSLTGLADHVGEWIDVCAVITCNDSYVTETWTRAMVDTCDHSWQEGERIPSTCGQKGAQMYQCEQCGAQKTEELPLLQEHTWDGGAVTKQPTCTVAGVKTYTCTVCGDQSRTESVAATGHRWNGGAVTKQPTCTETGVRTYTCTACGDRSRTESVAALGHAYAATYTTDTMPTCTRAGSESRHCTRCGAGTDARALPMAAHQGGAATCLEQAKCAVCGQSYGAKLPAVLELTAGSLKMRVKQSTTAFRVTEMAPGDYVTAVTSDNTKVLKVSSLNPQAGTFRLKAQKKTGKAGLTVQLASGLSRTITVTVQKGTVKTTAISGLVTRIALDKGKTVSLKPVVTPVTSQQKVTYKSSNKKVATVSSKGVVKAVKPGKATITVKSGGKSKKITVTVNPVRTTRITGVPETASVKKGKTKKLKPKLTPSGSTEKIKYTTSNKKVATVSAKGVIKGVSRGTATITVKSGNVQVTCTVTVK